MSWRYDEWNEYLCEKLFSWDKSGEFVYLLLDEEEIADVAPKMGLPPEDIIPSLAAAVRSRMWPRQPNNMFGWFASQIRLWELDTGGCSAEEELPLPPVVGLLCICSEAAKDMGSSGMNPSNFYRPLADLLGLDSTADDKVRQELGNSYRDVVVNAWDCVRSWCAHYEGQRGEVSVFPATSAEFVGLAVSQALLRESDRRHLPDFFRQYRLQPTEVTNDSEIQQALDDWIRSPYSSAGSNLRTIWRNAGVRSRVVDIVLRELRQWSGTKTSQVGQPRLSLAATFRRLPATRLRWLLVVENSHSEESVETTLFCDDVERDVTLVPTLDGELSLSLDPQDFDGEANAVSTKFELELPNGEYVERHPKRLSVLSKDPVSPHFFEAPRISLGQPSIVVTRNAIDSEAVRAVLREHADGGWKEVALVERRPDGGTAFVDVRIVDQGFAPGMEWLTPLSPREPATLGFEGGLLLGRNAWLHHLPPGVVAAVAGHAGFSLRLLDATDETSPSLVPDAFTDPTASPAELKTESIPPGRYRIELVGREAQAPIRSANIRLVTSDTIDIRAWRRSARLVRDFEHVGPLAAISAAPPRPGASSHVEGLTTEGLAGEGSSRQSPGLVSAWWQNKDQVLDNIERQRDDEVYVANWGDAIEGLMYLGGGTAEILTSIARQVMPSMEFAAWRFWRACSDLGHIEVAVDDLHSATTWRIVRPQVAETTDGHWYLCGYWPRRAVASLERELPDSVEVCTFEQGPSSTLIRNRNRSEVDKALANAGVEAIVVERTASGLASVLPTLNDVVAALPATPLPLFDRLTRFDVQQRRFVGVDEFGESGAYRVQARSMRSTVIVTDEDLGNRECRHADVDLAKHVAASMMGRPYLAYNEQHRVLATPFHVRLPFLYGRTATSCSGRLSYSRNASWTVYEAVTPDVAGSLFDRLTWREP